MASNAGLRLGSSLSGTAPPRLTSKFRVVGVLHGPLLIKLELLLFAGPRAPSVPTADGVPSASCMSLIRFIYFSFSRESPRLTQVIPRSRFHKIIKNMWVRQATFVLNCLKAPSDKVAAHGRRR